VHTGSVWRDRDFRSYWAAHTISQVGSAVTSIALPLVALLELDASALQVGLLRAAEFLPYLLLTLPAGELVDRFRRRPLMVGCDLVRAAALILIPIAAVGGLLSLPLLFAVAAVVGSATVLFDVASVSVLPSLVGRSGLLQANAALETSGSVALVAGPGLGGVLVGWVKASGAMAVDAFSYLFSAVCLLLVRAPEPAPGGAGTGGIRHLAVGLQQVRQSPVLRPLVIYLGATNLIFGLFEAILIVFEVRGLGLGGQQVGVVTAVGNVGAVIGALTSRRIATRVGIGWTLVVSALGNVLGSALVTCAPRSGPIPLLIAGQFVFGVTVLWFNIQSLSLRQAVTPDRVRGRVNAAVRMLGFGAIPLGAALGGLLGSWIGLRETLGLATALALLATVQLGMSPLRSLRSTPEEEPVWSSRAATA
jgi:MFS family permease